MIRSATAMNHQTTQHLTPAQRNLLRILREFQFGRIENLRVECGQPLVDCDTKIVRVARLGGKGNGPDISAADEYELKQAFCDLFDELTQLGDGLVLRLEFRHGLPWLLETAAAVGDQGSEPDKQGSRSTTAARPSRAQP